MSCPNFKELYTKALIPIAPLDLQVIKTLYPTRNSPARWLIALEGTQESLASARYVWTVMIFPAMDDGTIDWDYCLHQSEVYNNFNHAIERTRELEKAARQDKLTSLFLDILKIS